MSRTCIKYTFFSMAVSIYSAIGCPIVCYFVVQLPYGITLLVYCD